MINIWYVWPQIAPLKESFWKCSPVHFIETMLLASLKEKSKKTRLTLYTVLYLRKRMTLHMSQRNM